MEKSSFLDNLFGKFNWYKNYKIKNKNNDNFEKFQNEADEAILDYFIDECKKNIKSKDNDNAELSKKETTELLDKLQKLATENQVNGAFASSMAAKANFNIENKQNMGLLYTDKAVTEVGKQIGTEIKNLSKDTIKKFFDSGLISFILDTKGLLSKIYIKYKKIFIQNKVDIALILTQTPVNTVINLGRVGSDIRKILYNGGKDAQIDPITGRIAILGPAFSTKSKNITNIQKNTSKVLKEIKDKFIKEFEKGEHDAREKFNKLLSENDNNISKIFDSYNKNAEVYMYLGVINESNGQNAFKDLKNKIKDYLKLTPKTKIPYTTVKNSGESAADIKSKIEKSFKSFTKNSKSKEEIDEYEE